MGTGLSSSKPFFTLQNTFCLLLLLSELCSSLSDPSVFTIYSDVGQSCLESSGNTVGLSPVCNQSSEQQQWKWVSRLRLFNLGSRQCLAMLRQNLSGSSASLGTIECDLESAQTRWHCGKLGEQLGGFLSRPQGGGGAAPAPAPTPGPGETTLPDQGQGRSQGTWRIYKTNQDLCARPYHEIYTIQGNSNGKPCTIPFKYDNQWYHGCTTIGREDGHLWCATTVDYGRDERWGFCPIMSDNCKTFWDKDPLTNSCYQFNFQSTLSWNEARTSCQQQNSDLLSITELHEQTYINGLLTGYSATLWIGLNDLDIDGGWQWSDGSPLKFLNWEEDQPMNSLEENCGVIRTESSGRWQNKDCGIARPYVCKKKPYGTTLPDTTDVWRNWKTSCEVGWLPFQCHCYRLNGEKRTWAEARKSCVRTEGDLLSVHHLAELEFVLTRVKQDVEELWIGLNDIKLQMNFAWSDGSPVHFTYWHPYEPNNFHSGQEDCVTLWGADGRWNDGPCNLTLPSICKKASCLGEGEAEAETEDNLGCQKGWRFHSSSCYLVAEEILTFDEALKKCNDQSSALVTITNRFEQSFVISLILGRSGDSLWTGLTDTNHPGAFQWLGGDPVSFTNWNRDQPGINGGCVVLATGNSVGLWEVKDCGSFKAKYICRQNLATPVTPDPGPTLPTPSLTGSCPRGWLSSTQLRYCYKVFHSSGVQGKHSWSLAHASCVELGAQLLSIGSSEEEQFAAKIVHEIFGDSEEHEQHWFWIGLNRRNPGAGRSWKWSDGLGYSYHNFRRDAYDDDDVRRCAVLDMVSKQWMAARCETKLDWICKIRKGIAVREPEDTQGSASKQWLKFDEAEYKFFEHHSTWPQAQRICTWFGAELASVHSQRELSFLGKTLRKLSRAQDQPWWIGLQTIPNDGRFRWSDGSVLNFVSWASGKPRPITKDRKCVYMLPGKEEWGDQKCLTDLQYVCKRTIVSLVEPRLHPPPSVSGGCPVGWTPFLYKCFQVRGEREAERVSWIEGKAACERAGGLLATVSNHLQQAFITTLLPNITFDLWIGLHDTNKDFQWLEKEPVKFTNWAPGEPSGHRTFSITNELVNCAVVWHGAHPQYTGRWDDRSCRDEKHGYICQRIEDPSLPTSPNRFPPPLTPTLSYMNNSYRLIQKQLSWQEAVWLCESHNLTLASVGNAYTQAFLTQVLSTIQHPLWIGLSNTEGGSRYSWLGDRPVPYTHWQVGDPQPSGGCVYMEVDGAWRTSNCEVKQQGAICKVNTEAVSIKSQFNGTCPTRLQDSNWIAFRNHCYTFNLERKAAPRDAGTICRKEHGAEVLSILDETENVFVWEHLQMYEREARGAWLGLSYNPKGGSLVWSDKMAVNYSNWGHQSDSMRLISPNTCYWINSNTGVWGLGSCSNITLGLVCKRPRVQESDSPVSTELQSRILDIILYVLGGALLLSVLMVLVFLYRRRGGGHGARGGGAFESARYSRTTSAPSESLEKNILVSDMEMNEQQE